MQVESWRDSTWTGESTVAIAISGDADQRHVGVIHHSDERKETLLLDLAWHHRMRNGVAETDMLVIRTNLPPIRAAVVASYCRRVWEENEERRVPYGFGHPVDAFDPVTGAYTLTGAGEGLTCASFVLAIFHANGFPLLDYSTWKERPEDVEWQKRIIDLLAKGKHPATETHRDELAKRLGNTRFHPEEVAAGGYLAPPPASCEAVAPVAKEIVGKLLAL